MTTLNCAQNRTAFWVSWLAAILSASIVCEAARSEEALARKTVSVIVGFSAGGAYDLYATFIRSRPGTAPRSVLSRAGSSSGRCSARENSIRPG